MHASPSRLSAYALLAGSMALVGTYVALSKPLTAAIPVFLLAFLRFAIAAAAMVPWTLRGRYEAALSRTEHGLFFVMSFFGNFLFSICMLYGISLTTATAAGVIMATLPAVVALLSWLFLREKLTPRVLLAVGFAVGGIGLLQFARADEGSSRGAAQLGNLLMFGAVVCEAIYVIVAKRLAATRAPLRVSALINLWGLVLIAPLGLWQLARYDVGTITLPLCALLFFYSLAASLFAVWMWVAGLKHVPANQAGVFTVALPVAATAVGVFILGEPFTAIHAIAMTMAAAGVVLITSAPQPPPS
jgi:drug/metabolite transporter (DMT)-like permease